MFSLNMFTCVMVWFMPARAPGSTVCAGVWVVKMHTRHEEMENK